MFHLIALVFHLAWWVLARLPWLLGEAFALRFLFAGFRFARLPAGARKHYPGAVWARFRWRALARRLGFAFPDPHRPGVAIPTTTAATLSLRPARRLLYPRAKFTATEHGFRVRVRTIPGVGRAEIDQHAEHLADAFGAWRVSVAQPGPRYLSVKAFKTDPLTEAYPVTTLPRFDGKRLWLGKDEGGDVRPASLANHAGIAFSGNPGRGKTEAALSLVWQLAPSRSVELYILDGGELDWREFQPGAAAYVTELGDAVDVLHDLAAGMNERRRTLPDVLGVRNMWAVGPSEAWPLRVVLIEEVPAFLHVDKKRQAKADEAKGLIAGLLRRGRAPGYLTILMTQKATTTGGLDPDLRDLCGLRWSFGLASQDAAAAILGPDIRQYESLSPVQLQGDQHVGVASCLLRTGLSPYTLLRFPAVGMEQADAAALELANRRKPQIESAAPSLSLVS